MFIGDHRDLFVHLVHLFFRGREYSQYDCHHYNLLIPFGDIIGQIFNLCPGILKFLGDQVHAVTGTACTFFCISNIGIDVDTVGFDQFCPHILRQGPIMYTGQHITGQIGQIRERIPTQPGRDCRYIICTGISILSHDRHVGFKNKTVWAYHILGRKPHIMDGS